MIFTKLLRKEPEMNFCMLIHLSLQIASEFFFSISDMPRPFSGWISAHGQRKQKLTITLKSFVSGCSTCDFWISHLKILSCAKFQLLMNFSSLVIQENVNSKWRILGRDTFQAQIFKMRYFRNHSELDAEIFRIFLSH